MPVSALSVANETAFRSPTVPKVSEVTAVVRDARTDQRYESDIQREQASNLKVVEAAATRALEGRESVERATYDAQAQARAEPSWWGVLGQLIRTTV